MRLKSYVSIDLKSGVALISSNANRALSISLSNFGDSNPKHSAFNKVKMVKMSVKFFCHFGVFFNTVSVNMGTTNQ